MHITDKQLKVITGIATEKAIQAYNEYTSKKEKEQQDRRLHNTKLLLKKYRSFVMHCEEVKQDIEDLDKPVDIIDELDRDEYAVEAIKKSKRRTLMIVRFMNDMMSVFKTICERSSKQEERRRYDVLYKMYMSDKDYTAEEIATCHYVDTRTVYRDINKAVETLSGLMFGVDSIKFYK